MAVTGPMTHNLQMHTEHVYLRPHALHVTLLLATPNMKSQPPVDVMLQNPLCVCKTQMHLQTVVNQNAHVHLHCFIRHNAPHNSAEYVIIDSSDLKQIRTRLQ